MGGGGYSLSLKKCKRNTKKLNNKKKSRSKTLIFILFAKHEKKSKQAIFQGAKTQMKVQENIFSTGFAFSRNSPRLPRSV